MRPRFLVTAATALIFAFLSSPAPVRAESNLLFILDSSGSMWGKLEGKAKMETAKTALSKLVGDLPKDTKVGLMAYGHRVGNKEPGACADIELLMPIGKATPDDVVSWLERIKPKGKTPIAGSLRQTPRAFAGLEKSNNNIVLISDGIETCDGDPCAAAIELMRLNINLRVHVVGFDISEEDRSQLECIATFGKGKYFPANSTEGFTKAVTEAVKVAEAETKPELKPKPATPPPPKPVVYFEDNFDGDELADHWEVQNPAPDAFTVENGRLLLLSSSVTGFHAADMPNILTLNQDIPRGDWDIDVTFSGELSTGFEWLFLGLRKDEKNFLTSLFYHKRPGYGPDNRVMLRISKHVGGSETKADSTIWQPDWFELGYGAVMQKFAKGPATLTLSKRGRSYFATFRHAGLLDKNGDPHVFRTSKITSLRSPGELTLGIGLYEKAEGEFLALIDSVQIVKVGE